MPTRLPLLVLLATLATTSLAFERLDIVQPAELAAQYPNGMPNRPALFGLPDFASELEGVLVFADPPEACLPINPDSVPDPSDPNGIAYGQNIILLVDRGNCTFVRKVQMAENAGFNGVLIANNAGNGLVYMRDDGNGKEIEIPSLFIRQSDGQHLKDALGTGVTVRFTFGLPHPDNRVEWKLWTSSDDAQSVEFKKDFRAAAEALGDRALLIPKYRVELGTHFNSRYAYSGADCTNDNRYCRPDPNGDPSSAPDGRDAVIENLRQICLWRHLNATDQHLMWWDYVARFESICKAGSMSNWNVACSRGILDNMGIPRAVVDDCVTASGGTSGTGDNTILREMLEARIDENVYFIPTVMVNEEKYHGTLTCHNPVQLAHCGVLQAICSGFDSATAPSACRPKEAESSSSGGSDGVSPGAVVGIVIAVVVVLTVIGVWYFRRQRQQIRLDLDNILSSYMTLENANEAAGHGEDGAGDQETLI